jgi:hypothetical protein
MEELYGVIQIPECRWTACATVTAAANEERAL